MSDSRTKKEVFLPYRYDKLALELHVNRVVSDGEVLEQRVDGERKLVTLEGPWTDATLELSASVTASLVSSVLPAEEQAHPPVSLVVAASCAETRLRRGLTLTATAPDPTGARRYAGELRLRRDELSGHLELQPFLIRTEPAQTVFQGFALHAGARLAGGRAWEVRVDRRKLPEGKYLEVRMKSFAADPNIPERDRGNVSRLDCDQPAPTLWLNSDHAPLAQALSSQATVGVAARLREVAFDQLSFSVWSQLLLRAVHHRFVEGEFVYDWEEGVLETLARWMYPDKPTPAAQLAQLEYEREELGLLLARLDAALQRENELATHLLRLIEETAR